MRGSLSLLDPIGEVSIVTGNAVRGAGWYGPNTGLHSVAIRVLNFQGRISLQASLAATPGSNDWFSVLPLDVPYWQYPRPGYIITDPNNTGETSNVGFNFTYNVIWVRAIVDRSYLVGGLTSGLSSVYFDALHDVQDVNMGADGADDHTTIIAQSFYASNLVAPVSLTFTLAAANPNDGGSLAVYLVPDDGSGGGTGIAGNPTHSGIGNSITFTNAQLIGMILDSSLTTTPTSISFDMTPNISTLNGEYWIAIMWQNSSAKWWYSDYAPGAIGIGNQAFANNYNQSGLHTHTLTPGINSIGPYQMVVASAPALVSSNQFAFLGTVDCILLNY